MIKHYLSDESLAQFPDFQQRLSVLQSLKYVDEKKETITLKVRETQ